MQKLNSLSKYTCIFIGLILILLTIYVAIVKFIPKEAIVDNVKESIPYVAIGLDFKEVKPSREYSSLHVFSDERSLNIVYCLDSEHPLKSIMEAKYYKEETDTKNIIHSLKGAIENGGQGNQEYLRYWHGNIIILRPLLIFFNINQIYYIFAGIMIILTVIIFAILIKKRQYLLLLATIVGYIMVAINYVPFCVEYVFSFFIMQIVCIIALLIKKYNVLFFITGMLTCFFDLLSTEIITLFVPMLYILMLKYKSNEINDIKKLIKELFTWAILWLLGYCLMWGAKWLLASIILNINALDYVIDEAVNRVNGKVGNYTTRYVIWNALALNIKTIYPFFMIKNTATVVCIIASIIIATILLMKRDKKSIAILLIFIGIALMPYIRYLILYNHSFVHSVFTFRDQLITIIALIVGIGISIDKKRLNKEVKIKKKTEN